LFRSLSSRISNYRTEPLILKSFDSWIFGPFDRGISELCRLLAVSKIVRVRVRAQFQAISRLHEECTADFSCELRAGEFPVESSVFSVLHRGFVFADLLEQGSTIDKTMPLGPALTIALVPASSKTERKLRHEACLPMRQRRLIRLMISNLICFPRFENLCT
jgi:hypothetical protein